MTTWLDYALVALMSTLCVLLLPRAWVSFLAWRNARTTLLFERLPDVQAGHSRWRRIVDPVAWCREKMDGRREGVLQVHGFALVCGAAIAGHAALNVFQANPLFSSTWSWLLLGLALLYLGLVALPFHWLTQASSVHLFQLAHARSQAWVQQQIADQAAEWAGETIDLRGQPEP